jgi:hypothetical protein
MNYLSEMDRRAAKFAVISFFLKKKPKVSGKNSYFDQLLNKSYEALA